MEEEINLDRVRIEALDRIDRIEKRFNLTLYAAAAFELFFLTMFLVLIDPHNRLHLLLFFSTVGSYTMVILGLVMLGAHVNRNTARVLKALQLLAETPQPQRKKEG